MDWACGACGGSNPEGMKFCGHCGAPAGQSVAPRQDEVAEALKSFVSQQVADHLVASGGDITEERRLVTALFADLSGFTPLADRLDPEELLEVIDPIIERLTNIVGRYEGYVDKFAGDALLAFFGAPVAHEDDAQRALNVAIEMHEELAKILPELPPHAGELTMHIGVNSGRVIARVLGSEVRMDYSVLGDAVILAQRLESAAPAGETYVGETTHLLTSDSFDFEPVGQLTLKGKAEPVSAYKLIGKKKRSRSAARFVGREQQLATVDSALASFADGAGGVISVSGEPGVGKSRFTEEVMRRASELGAQWLTARCLTYGAGIAYWPVSELFRRIAGIAPTDPPESALRQLRETLEQAGLPEAVPPLARLLGLPSPETDELEPEPFRRLLHETVIGAVSHLARSAPLVLAVEDLHWGDASSVALIADLARLCTENPLVIYVTGRTEAVGVLLEIAAGADEPLRHSIQLDPMDNDAVEPLVTDFLGGDVSPAVVNVVQERAVGNPFFVQELLRSLRESGEIVEEGDGWVLSPTFDPGHIPPTIEGVLSARLDVLPRPAVSTLQISSVIGRRIRVPLLRAVDDDPELDLNLKGLLDAGLLDPGETEDEYVFHHALVQDVAYSRLLRKRRRELHLKVAEEAERLYGAEDDSIDLLARHLHLAGAGEKAIRYLVRAGRRAARLFANDEALIHLQHAADLARADTACSHFLDEVLLEIAGLHELRGNYEEALRLYEDVKEGSNAVEAWRGIAASLRNRSDYQQAHETVDAAFEQGFPQDAMPELFLEKGWILSREGRYAEALSVLQEGLGASDRKDATIGQIHLQITRAHAVLGNLSDALKHALAGVLIFEEAGDLKGFSTAMRILGDTYRQLNLLDDAVAALRRGLELAKKTGNAEEIAGCLINLGLVELSRDAVETAIGCDRQAIEAFEGIAHVSGQAIGRSNLAEKLVLAGRPDEAALEAATALELARSIGHQQTVGDVTDTIAMIHLAKGEFDAAARQAEVAAEIYLEMEAVPAAARSLQRAVEAYELKGDKEKARAVEARASSLIEEEA